MTKLFDSELNVMDLLWKEGDMTAKSLAKKLHVQVGWSRTTTYTIIKKLVTKGVIERIDPDFVCHPVISREQVQKAEVDHLIGKMFDGSPGLLINTLLSHEDIPDNVIDELKKIVKEME